MVSEFVGPLGVITGVLVRFWPVWLALALVLAASFTYKKRLGL